MMPIFAISIFERLEDISDEWPEGVSSTHGARYHPFQSLTFLKVWMATFGRSGRRSLHFVEVRDPDGQPILFAPLCISTRNGTRVLEFIDADAADYNAPVLFPAGIVWTEGLVGRLWNDIVRLLPRFDIVLFSKMPSEIGGLPNPFSLLGDRPNDVACHGNDLRRSWPEIEALIPRRKVVMKRKRQLQKLAPLQFGLAEGGEMREAVTAAFLRQKQWRFEQTRVPGFDVDLDKRDFFQRGTEVFAEEGMLKLFYLTSGDTIIATLWGLVVGRRYHAVMISFEAGEWARFSPGSQIYQCALEWLHANGFDWFDLGIGDEPWKLASCETAVSLNAWQAPRTWQGRVFLVRNRVLTVLRSTPIWRSIRPLKWVVVRKVRQGVVTLSGYGPLGEFIVPLAVAV